MKDIFPVRKYLNTIKLCRGRDFLLNKKEYNMKKLTNEIFRLCRDISMETSHDVFLNYSPHVQGIEIGIHTDGWIKNASKDKGFCIYLISEWKTPEEIEQELENCIEYLKKLK